MAVVGPWTLLLGLFACRSGAPAPSAATPSSPGTDQRAAMMYVTYCALCHGNDRAGYAADQAPSLRSPELMGRAPLSLLTRTVEYGRPDTAMAGFGHAVGGPLSRGDIRAIVDWLVAQAQVERVDLPDEPVTGDPARGEVVYGEHCAVCHGAQGQGGQAPAVGNSVFLATASDAYIKDTVLRGRTHTPMVGFEGVLPEADINAVTAFLRSRAVGWEAPATPPAPPPEPSDFVLNPQAPAAAFSAREGRYVPAADVAAALEAGQRMVLLDARPVSDWLRSHLPGAVSVPFYNDVADLAKHLPNDDTYLVAYCACPHAASGRVVDALKELGFENAVILDEGVLEWASRGYPMEAGDTAGSTP